MLDFTLDELKVSAQKILELNPDPVPRFRLLRDVLQLAPTSADYLQAENTLQTSRWITLLVRSQWSDGTWGRFHTQDTSVKQPFATTEGAITTALDSGLDRHSPLLHKVQKVLLEYIDGKNCWPDPPEKHDNPQAWYVVLPHYTAGILAQIDKFHPRLDDFWNLWAEAARVSFQSGTYDRQKEIEVLNLLMKCRMKKPVPFHIKPILLILSATHNRLPESLERQVLNYLMRSPAGIYYIFDKNLSEFPPILSRNFWGWFQAHKLLSRFHLWRELAEDAINWIWTQRSEDGFWDVGRKIARKPYTCFPLSESWKRPENRKIDCSVEVMDLLSRCFVG